MKKNGINLFLLLVITNLVLIFEPSNMDIQEIKKLPIAKRILLVQDIWDSLEAKEDIQLTEEVKAELDSRIEHHKSGKATYYTLEESRARNAKVRNDL